MVKICEGDLLASHCNVICHQTNCMGVMGSGIARAIRASYPAAYQALVDRYARGEATLGSTDIVWNEDGRYVVNCYAQQNYLPRGVRHTNYEALQACLSDIKRTFYGKDYVIGFPYKIGCGLGGGDWSVVYKMICDTFEGEEWNVEIWRLN